MNEPIEPAFHEELRLISKDFLQLLRPPSLGASAVAVVRRNFGKRIAGQGWTVQPLFVFSDEGGKKSAAV